MDNFSKLFICMFLVFISCNENNTVKYKNGNIKEIKYSSNGNIDSIYHYYKNEKIKQKEYFKNNDTVSYKLNFGKDGNLSSKKILLKNKNNLQIGKEYFFDTTKISVLEYFVIDNERKINQIWFIDKKFNEPIYGAGNSFQSDHFNTIIDGDTILVNRFFLEAPYYNSDSDIEIILPKKDNQLKSDFSNFHLIEKDTFESVKNDNFPHNNIADIPKNHYVEFGLEYNNKKKLNLRGMLVEYVSLSDIDISKYEKGIVQDSLRRIERRLYFDKTIYIDSVGFK